VTVFSLIILAGFVRVMIIDLDAHQGNGHEHDFMNNSMFPSSITSWP
jgi:acetoin utilization deacetylase AcuC-like enzyme